LIISEENRGKQRTNNEQTMDKRKFNGAKVGENRNAGRKPKATEIELIESLSPLDTIAFKQLEKGVKEGSFQFIKLFMEYRFGKPKNHEENAKETDHKHFIIEVTTPEQRELNN
jgi:hypothetical protein